ncbi:MAG TPA: hypothetical protein VJY62_21590 [Bacteroidia bacterium]|nr:hypothetical protein [Bacteroidia bacterium]
MNKLCLIIMFITCGVCNGQNIIPNGNFEQYSSCPSNTSQLDLALPWFNPTQATPDYFNQCATGFNPSVPYNYFGFQQTYDGMGYSGVVLFHNQSANTREYIEVPLTDSLTANECYHFEMHINLGNNCMFTSNDIGVYFSDSIIGGILNNNNLTFTPQINFNLGVYTDTLNWTLLSGNFTALGVRII